MSHTSAALLHGLPRPWGPTGAVCLTARDSTRTAAHDDWRRVLDGALPGDHVTVVEGVPVTTVDRTVVDCLRTLRLRDGLAIADAALGAGATVVRALERVRRQQRGWPGVRTADLGISLADGRRESWLESASVGTAVALGWPVPLSQVAIHRLDAERAEAFMVRERDRERELESVGLAVARWGSSALRAGGGGLEVALRAASHRARADRVRCLWRDEAQGVLREWRELPPAPRIPRHLLPVNRHPGRRRPVW